VIRGHFQFPPSPLAIVPGCVFERGCLFDIVPFSSGIGTLRVQLTPPLVDPLTVLSRPFATSRISRFAGFGVIVAPLLISSTVLTFATLMPYGPTERIVGQEPFTAVAEPFGHTQS
jgi:hypothetical protein